MLKDDYQEKKTNQELPDKVKPGYWTLRNGYQARVLRKRATKTDIYSYPWEGNFTNKLGHIVNCSWHETGAWRFPVRGPLDLFEFQKPFDPEPTS